MSSRPPVDLRKVNGLSGDPAVYAFFPKTGAGVLFDLGSLERLPTRELLRVRLALVSHTHIDHFIGFDRLLRVNIPHGRTIEIVGPSGIIANVHGKLQGYLWNLLAPDQLCFVVHQVEVTGAVTSVRLASASGFVPEALAPATLAPGPLDRPLPGAPRASIAAFGDGTRFEAVALDHRTPSLAYACQLPVRFHVKESALLALGLAPGPWIRDLQAALGRGEPGYELDVGGRRYQAGELAPLIVETSTPRPLGYLTDAGFTRDNLARAVPLLQQVQVFVCETNYRDAEVARARDRMHLTTRQAALIAAAAAVESLEIFHVSNIYADSPEAVAAEAAGFFELYRALSAEQLHEAIEGELARVASAS